MLEKAGAETVNPRPLIVLPDELKEIAVVPIYGEYHQVVATSEIVPVLMNAPACCLHNSFKHRHLKKTLKTMAVTMFSCRPNMIARKA